jgi:hypothetical protein
MSEKITQLIEQIEKDTKESEAYLYIHVEPEQHGFNDLIEGNAQGLRLLAAALLKHSLEVEKGHFDIADLSGHEWSMNKTIPVSIVGLAGARDQILKDRQDSAENTRKKANFGDWGCLIILFLVLILVVFGVVSLVRLF